MKNLILTILFLAFVIAQAAAQLIPTTSRATICKCLPDGWSNVIGSQKVTSDQLYYGSNQVSYLPILPVTPSGASTFIGMNGGAVSTSITGLIAGKTYKFYYSVISAHTNYSFAGEDYSAYFSKKASFRVTNGSGSGVGQLLTNHYVDFDPASDNGVWKSSAFEFTAVSSTATLLFEDLQIADKPGFLGLDLSLNPIVLCNAGVKEVPLKTTTAQIVCPATTVNLVTEFVGGLIPAGTSLVFFDNPTHSGLPLSNPNVAKGTYYAFYFDGQNQCYNTDYSLAKMEVTYLKCVDLTPGLDIDGLSFLKEADRDFVVNLYEVNGQSTSANISFRITKLGGFTISYPTNSGTSKVLGGTINQNSNWTFTENDNFITATSTVPIQKKGQAVIGFNIKRKAGIPKGVSQNITPTILNAAGGDSNVKNNSVVTSVSAN